MTGPGRYAVTRLSHYEGSVSTRKRQKEQTRERIYQAALEAFRRDGLQGARIEDIAHAAGVSRGTFYFHFATREDVLRDLLQRSQRDLVDRIDLIPDSAPLSSVLQACSAHMALSWQDDPRLLGQLSSVALAFPGGLDGLDTMAEAHPSLATLIPRFEAAAARGELGPLIPPDLAAGFFLTNLFAAGVAWSGTPDRPLRPLLDGVVLFFLKGAGP